MAGIPFWDTASPPQRSTLGVQPRKDVLVHDMSRRLISALLGRRCPLCLERQRRLYPHLAVTHRLSPSKKAEVVSVIGDRQRHGR